MSTSDFIMHPGAQDLLFAVNGQALGPDQCVGGDGAYRGISGVIVPYQGSHLSEAHDKFNRTLRKEREIAKRSVARIRKFRMFASQNRKYALAPQTMPLWFKVASQIANFKAKYKYNLAERVPYSQVLRKVKRWQSLQEEEPSVVVENEQPVHNSTADQLVMEST
mgnify:CR=1 FL=1